MSVKERTLGVSAAGTPSYLLRLCLPNALDQVEKFPRQVSASHLFAVIVKVPNPALVFEEG